MITGVDLGFGAIKGIGSGKEIEYPSAVGNFNPVRCTVGMEEKSLIEKLCVDYEGNKYFIGEISFTQSVPRVTMNSERFTSKEGLALIMTSLVLLSNNQHENIELVTGLPVDMYKGLKDQFKNTLLGKHNIKLLNTDGDVQEFYAFNIEKVNILPQPMGTIFDHVLDNSGKNINEELGAGRIAVLDIGKHTVDLIVTDKLTFIDRLSTSFNDIGIYDVCKEFSLALKDKGKNIPADSMEPYIRNIKPPDGLAELKETIFSNQAEKITSRVINTWQDLWSFDKIYITGGGAVLLGDYIKNSLNSDQVEICDKPTFTNCRGYYKFANLMWG